MMYMIHMIHGYALLMHEQVRSIHVHTNTHRFLMQKTVRYPTGRELRADKDQPYEHRTYYTEYVFVFNSIIIILLSQISDQI